MPKQRRVKDKLLCWKAELKTVKCKGDRAGQGRGEAKGLDENEIADVLEIWIVSQGDQTADESTAKADRSHLPPLSELDICT